MNDKLKALRNSAEFAEEKLVASVQSLLEEILQKRGLNKADLARKMGVSKARVSQIFSDNQNFTLRLLASAFHALDEELVLNVSSGRIEFKGDGCEPSDSNFEAKVRELSHGFEWLDKVSSGRQLLGDRRISDEVFAKAFADFVASDALGHSEINAHNDANAANEWRNAATNVVPFKRRA